MRAGRRLAIDLGAARVGLAMSDSHGILASPLPALLVEGDANSIANELKLLEGFDDVIEVYVGHPIDLAGNRSLAAKRAEDIARTLSSSIFQPVRLVDERLTTKVAASLLSQGGKTARTSKDVIDSASAVVMLEAALSFERENGSPPGIAIEDLE